jgi:outer membrane protein OmpA-like peptidoglycan-associated protein
MNKISLTIHIAVVAVLLSSCASQQVRRNPDPVVQKPRDVIHVYFDFDKSNLKSEEKDKLSPTISELRKHPSWVAQLEGHADAIGASAYNMKLGDKRARSVKEAMVLDGVPPEQLVILSFGEDKPVATNREDAGRARNRRVEVKVR